MKECINTKLAEACEYLGATVEQYYESSKKHLVTEESHKEDQKIDHEVRKELDAENWPVTEAKEVYIKAFKRLMAKKEEARKKLNPLRRYMIP